MPSFPPSVVTSTSSPLCQAILSSPQAPQFLRNPVVCSSLPAPSWPRAAGEHLTVSRWQDRTSWTKTQLAPQCHQDFFPQSATAALYRPLCGLQSCTPHSVGDFVPAAQRGLFHFSSVQRRFRFSLTPSPQSPEESVHIPGAHILRSLWS